VRAITFTIQHNIKAVGSTIENILNAIQLKHILNEENLFEIKVVLNELIVNSLCHGNQCEIQKATYVTYKLMNDILYISVKDEGHGFEPKFEIVSMDDYIKTTNNNLCEHGRGLIIVEKLCDKVKFNKCGNKVAILKSLHELN
jgi:serine/threonine-protein kinase RsbW